MASATEPPSKPAGYSGTPLAKKLGVHPGSTVALVGAPAAFEIPDLPAGAQVRRSARAPSDVTVWFVASLDDLSSRVAGFAGRAAGGALWICWPKRSSGVRSEVTEAAVRAAGLGAGLVDFKIAAIDSTWSGLRFAPAGGRRGHAAR